MDTLISGATAASSCLGPNLGKFATMMVKPVSLHIVCGKFDACHWSSSAPPLPSISFSLSFMSPLSLSHKLVDRRLHLGCCVVGALWVGPGPAHFQGTDVWLQGEEIENMERERKRKGTEGDALLGAEYEQKRNDWYSPCELCASSPKQLISMSSPLPPSLPPSPFSSRPASWPFFTLSRP